MLKNHKEKRQVFDLDSWDKFKRKCLFCKEFYFVPHFRRVLRFIALPYCYFFMVNWDECKAGRFQVIIDFCYIFFVLKYFPDNYSLCRLWEKEKSEWAYYYGSNYDPYQRRNLRVIIQKKEFEVIFENKYICYQICRAEGLPLPVQYQYIKNKENCIAAVVSIFKESPHKKLIVKPVDGRAGKGILLLAQEDAKILARAGDAIYELESMPFVGPAVIQECLSQHPSMAKMSPASINTVRIVTFLADSGEVIIVGASARFGLGNSFVDNKSQGGIGVGVVLENGRLMKYGFDFSSRRLSDHPDSGLIFQDFEIPMWKELLALAERTQMCFQYFRLLGQDIAITKKGPVLIELNSIYDNVGLEQCCGPILKDPLVLRQYCSNNLLINRKQKALYELVKN